MTDLTVAVVGATGQVGRVMRTILEERNFPCTKVRFFASERSAGQVLQFRGEDVVVEDVNAVSDEDLKGIDIAVFSAGATRPRHRLRVLLPLAPSLLITLPPGARTLMFL